MKVILIIVTIVCVSIFIFAYLTGDSTEAILRPNVREKDLPRIKKMIQKQERKLVANYDDRVYRCTYSSKIAALYFGLTGEYEQAIKWSKVCYATFKNLNNEQKQRLPYRNGDAIEVYEAMALFRIGNCYYLVGKEKMAVEMWRKVARKHPNKKAGVVSISFLNWIKEKPEKIYNYQKKLLGY